MPLLPPIRNPLGGLGGVVHPLQQFFVDAYNRNQIPRAEWAKTHPYGIPAQIARYQAENPNPSPWEDEPINTAFKTFAGGLGRQLGEVGMQTIQGLNPVPMVQGAAWSLQHPIERMQSGGDMMMPIGRGIGMRTGPARTIQESMQNQAMLDMWKDASRSLNTAPVMSSTKAFALQALKDYRMKKDLLDKAASRRARLDQVMRFQEDINALEIPDEAAAALQRVDAPIFARLMDLRHGVQSQISEGALTSRTPGAADTLEHVQNRIQQGLEIGRQRAQNLPPEKAAAPNERAHALQARAERARGTLAELGPRSMWESPDVTAARQWAEKELHDIEIESFGPMRSAPHSELLARGVQSYIKKLPRNRNPLNEYPR